MTHVPGDFEHRPSLVPPDRLARIALAYLAAPLFLYFLGWFQSAPGIVLLALLGYACWRTLRTQALAKTPWPSKRLIVLALFIAIGWSVFGGAGHFFYANAHDWIIRDAVLRDLVVASWPPGYTAGDGGTLLLRAPVAYFLPAAAIAKLTGAATADRLLWLWTVVGLTIFFLLLPLRHASLGRACIALMVVVLFSGMDIVGYMFPDFHAGNIPLKGAFIDWWIKPPPLVSYWSNTANLFWNPNHSLPAWISIALFYRHWRHPAFISIAALLVAVLPLWSPFALIGMLPFFLMLSLRWWTKRPHHGLDLPVIAACVAIAGVIGITLVVPASGIQYGSTLITPPERGGWIYLNNFNHFLTFAENYLLFVIFEFAILALLVSRAVDRWLFATALATLLILPFLTIGPGNDLAMRSSIPALGILCIATISAITAPPAAIGLRHRLLIGAVLALGAVTPYYEFDRATSRKPWSPNLDFTLIDANNGLVPNHYVVEYHRSPVAAALKVPTPLANAVDWWRYCEPIHPRNKLNRPYVARTWRANRNDEEVRQIRAQREKLP